MGLLVSIDNGGTLTDVCATDGVSIFHAKTLTTPHDLTECFLKCLEALCEKLGGDMDLPRLVGSIDYLRYSTTQGTNAIVQRKGPRIGLLTDDDEVASAAMNAAPALFEAFVGDRVRVLSASAAKAEDDNSDLVTAVSRLVSAGASRIVIAFSGDDAPAREKAAKRILYRAFPRHLLGAVPLLFSTELTRLGSLDRRVWTSVINAFLHPAMETFLYNAENRLRAHRARKPLLIFCNDGNSTRVAKTVAIKTYSSGPQGGVVGGEVLLRHYGIPAAVSIDIGGTTTDIAMFEECAVKVAQSGTVEGAPVSISLSAIESIGAGGGSIIRAEGGKIAVGPESVGSAPGPACFARGGTKATMTDAFLVLGILDPASYFGGRMPLDRERAERTIMMEVGEPLGLTLAEAAEAMADAYHGKIAAEIGTWVKKNPKALLLAFGGAGPMSACGVAEKAGLDEVLIPKFAAVFSAYGIAFSDIEHSYMAGIEPGRDGAVEAAKSDLLEQARRGMLAEGYDLAECDLDYAVLTKNGEGYARAALNGHHDGANTEAWLELRVTRRIEKIVLGKPVCEEIRKAKPTGIRKGTADLPLFRLEDLEPGDWFDGPCLVEEAFFTTHVRNGWRFVVSGNGDVLLKR